MLSFVAQLCAPSLQVVEAEQKALRLMVPGPGAWCSTEDLFYAATRYGQARDFPSVSRLCQASQKRVMDYENDRNGGLQIDSKWEELQRWCGNTAHLDRLLLWNRWFNEGPIATLRSNNTILEQQGLTCEAVTKYIGNHRAPGAIRIQYQRSLSRLLAERHDHNPYWRIRSKLDRWQLPGSPGPTVTRVSRALERLKELTAPRVRAAVWRTLFNGWTTARRFQRTGKCVLGCNEEFNEDSIEHYAHCAAVRSLSRNFLGSGVGGTQPAITSPSNAKGDFIVLGLNQGSVEDALLTKRAILVYAVYRATNLQRHSDDVASIVESSGILQQYAKEAVRGHSVSTGILLGANCFRPNAAEESSFLGQLVSDDWH